MPCDIKIQINSYNSDKNEWEKQVKIIKSGVEETDPLPSFSDIAEYVMRLSKVDRSILASKLIASKVQTLTNSDVKKHIFISNTDVETLKNKYPDLQNLFPDLNANITDNYVIINCAQMELNGSSYFGRTIDSNGQEIFFIKGFYGAQHLFNYLDVKNKLQSFFENSELYNKYKQDLNLISKKYNVDEKTLLLDYLNHNKPLQAFQTTNKLVIPNKVFKAILTDLKNEYNTDAEKTDLQILIESIKKYTKNPYEWTVNIDSLYSVLEIAGKNLPSKEEFSKMSLEDLETFLHEIFKEDPKLLRARIKNFKQGSTTIKQQEEKSVSILNKDLEKDWQEIKDQSGDKLQAFKTELKNNPEKVLNYFKNFYKKGFVDSEGVKHTDLDFKIVDGKIKISYLKAGDIKTVTKAGEITLYFPWASIGDLYNFNYDTKYLFSPVKKQDDPELDQDGMYKGAYIYEYYDEPTHSTHYAISRHIISPESYMHTYPTLSAAKAKIDSWQNTQNLNTWGLFTIKQVKGRPRKVKLECGNLNEGQIITTLDIELPNIQIKYLPQLFKDAINGNLINFYNIFKEIPEITALDTPEKAAAFIFKFYEVLNLSERKNIAEGNIHSLQYIITTNLNVTSRLIKEINSAESVSYKIEELKGNIATLALLQDNGNNVQVEGTYAEDKPVNVTTIANMESAVKYFNDKFNLSIQTMTQSELLEFDEKNNLGLNTKLNAGGIRAFIYNGQIYINSSNANLSDLFHEISHIFLGMLKIKYPEAYTNLINSYVKTKDFVRIFNSIDTVYKNFSNQDKIEETVVDIIAHKMFNKQSLVSEFKGQEFIDDFNLIFNKVSTMLGENLDNGLGFEGFMDTMLKDKDNISNLKRNMKISQLFQNLKNNGNIKEICN